jgi:hypothetical protein
LSVILFLRYYLSEAGQYFISYSLTEPVSGDTVRQLDLPGSNAEYWYKRAEVTIPDNTLEQEWQRLYALLEEQ